MNYRHAFHAGNFADVHKHLTLLAVLNYLLHKAKPLLYLDTHAGRGMYDLHNGDAERSEEWRQGIGRLFDGKFTSPLITRYLQAIQQAQGGATLQRYPGSPWIAASALRSTDRRIFVEQQAEECVALRKQLRQQPQHMHHTSIDDGDGYAALNAYLPPKERRGLVLVDPPFERSDEFSHLAQALIASAARWPTGVYCLWYPLKAGGAVNVFYAALKRSGLRKLLLAELNIRPTDAPLGLNGSGLLLMNPPWQLDTALRSAYAELLPVLAPDHQGSSRVTWLVPE